MSSASSSSWHTLPNEMKLAIIDTLDVDDVKSFAKVDQRTYQACVPAQFKVLSSLNHNPYTISDYDAESQTR